MRSSVKHHRWTDGLIPTVLLLVLALKFLWRPVVLGDVLGFDAGINRFLFLRYAAAFPGLPALEPWAREHAPGLFLLAAPLLRLGLPVDWMLTWIWGVVPVLLVGSLAFVTGKRLGRAEGIATLILGILSLPLYDGFALMYWKTFAALLFAVWAFHCLERRSVLWGLAFLFLVAVTHQQTALLAGLAVATFFLLQLPVIRWNARTTLAILGLVIVTGVAALFYLPVWSEAVRAPLLSVLKLRGNAAPAGFFLTPAYYLGLSWPVYLLGLLGCVTDLRRHRGTLWQCAALWAAVFVLCRLVFYRRFFLQLDFFLLPFAALALAGLWRTWRGALLRAGLVTLVALQAWIAVADTMIHRTVMDAELRDAIPALASQLPSDATVLGLENISATALLGWLPDRRVIAPGLFGDPWSPEDWKQFLLGTHRERAAMIKRLPAATFLFVSPMFRSYYGQRATEFLRDPCLEATDHPMLLRIAARCL